MKRMKKNYKKRIYLISVSIAMTVVILFSCSVYAHIRKTMLQREIEHGSRLMLQINNNLNIAADQVRETSYSIFENVHIKKLMYMDAEEPLYSFIHSGNSVLDNIMPTNPAIRSIYVYNENTDKFYSIDNGIFNLDEDFNDRWKRGELFGPRHMLLRFDRKVPLCTYVQQDNYNLDQHPCSAVFVNFDIMWLLDSLELCRDPAMGEMLFYLDEQDHLITAGINKSLKVSQQLVSDIYLLDKRPELQGEFPREMVLDGTSYLVQTAYNDSFSWRIYYLIPSQNIYVSVHSAFRYSLILLLCAIAVLLGLYYGAARWLYRPVKRIVAMVPEKHMAQSTDEFSAVESYYHQQLLEIRQLRSDELVSSQVLDMAAVNRLLHGSHILSEEGFLELKKVHRFHIDYHQPYRVCVMGFDDSEVCGIRFRDPADRMAAITWIQNRIQQDIADLSPCDFAFSDKNCYAMILQEQDSEALGRHLLRLQLHIQEKFSEAFTMAMSGPYQGSIHVTDAYQAACQVLQYRLVYGPNSLITWEMAEENRIHRPDFHSELEPRVMTALAQGDYGEMFRCLEGYLNEVRQLDYSGLQITISLLFGRIRRTIYQMNHDRITPVDMNLVSRLFDESRLLYLDQIPGMFEELVKLLESKELHPADPQKNVVDQACSLIAEQFSDPSLGAAALALQLDLSANQLGKFFKKYLNQSIPEYIRHIRMEKAVEWIRNSDLTVSEIAIRVGYSGESYFFRSFKEEFGMTPRQYEKSIHRAPSAASQKDS